MKDYQNDKYENFFRNLKVAREALALFAEFTAAAVAKPGVDALVAGHGPTLTAAAAALRADMVLRQGQAGSSQTGTSAEKTAFAAFVAFVQATDKKVLTSYFFDHAAERTTYYPDKLVGLTKAPVKNRLTRLTAYTQALEASSDKTIQAQGAPARALLAAYEAASTAKTLVRTDLQQTIQELGPAAEVVADALWGVHTAAVYAHRFASLEARRYFNYASLPSRTVSAKKKTATQDA